MEQQFRDMERRTNAALQALSDSVERNVDRQTVTMELLPEQEEFRVLLTVYDLQGNYLGRKRRTSPFATKEEARSAGEKEAAKLGRLVCRCGKPIEYEMPLDGKVVFVCGDCGGDIADSATQQAVAEYEVATFGNNL